MTTSFLQGMFAESVCWVRRYQFFVRTIVFLTLWMLYIKMQLVTRMNLILFERTFRIKKTGFYSSFVFIFFPGKIGLSVICKLNIAWRQLWQTVLWQMYVLRLSYHLKLSSEFTKSFEHGYRKPNTLSSLHYFKGPFIRNQDRLGGI